MEEKEMLPGKCMNCPFCAVKKNPDYLQPYKKQIILICEITGQTLELDKCPYFR
jgi:hypothetical protein